MKALFLLASGVLAFAWIDSGSAWAASCVPDGAQVSRLSTVIDDWSGSYEVQVLVPKTDGVACEKADGLVIYRNLDGAQIRVVEIQSGRITQEMSVPMIIFVASEDFRRIQFARLPRFLRLVEFNIEPLVSGPSSARLYLQSLNALSFEGRDVKVEYWLKR